MDDFEQLSSHLVATVVDPAAWMDALKSICEYTSTQKALLSLRESSTARIIIPEGVEDKYNSPLIYGFSEDEVGKYLTRFAGVDPWTDIEKHNHPYIPYAMSSHLPVSKLSQTDYWNWLSVQGLDDSVVAEIGHGPDWWASLNLYFGQTSEEKARKVLVAVKRMLPVLKPLWSASREVQLKFQERNSAERLIELVERPIVLMNYEGFVVRHNSFALTLFEDVFSIPLKVGKPIRIPSNVNVLTETETHEIVIPRVCGDVEYGGFASLGSVEKGELMWGERTGTMFLSFYDDSAESGVSLLDMARLTKREIELVRLVGKGRKLKEAQEKMSISHARVMQLWRSVRSKLGIADATELRVMARLDKKNSPPSTKV